MENGLLPWSDFSKRILQSLWTLTRCNSNVDQTDDKPANQTRALVEAKLVANEFPTMTLRASIHHGPWSRTMEYGLFHGPTSMLWFLKKSIYKAFGSLTRCKPNGMTMHQKVNVLIFLIYAQKRPFWKGKRRRRRITTGGTLHANL